MNLQVTGQLTQIEARNAGWFAVAIQEEGRDWPIKLSTKRQELVGLAQQLMGQMVSAVYTEQESTNINPHSGQPYTNRYLEALSLAGQPIQVVPQQITQPQQQQIMQQPVQQPMTQHGVTQPSVTQQPVQARQVDRQAEVQRIHRQSAAKVAVQLLPHILKEGEEATLAGLLRISEALVKYFNDGVQWKVAADPDDPLAHPGSLQSNPGHSVAAEPRGDGAQQAYEQTAQGQGEPGGFAQPLDPYEDIPFLYTIY